MRRAQPRTDMTFSIFLPPQAESGREAAGRLVSVGPHLHPRQCHRKGRVSRRLRRARPDLRRAGHQSRAARMCRRSRRPMDFGQGAGFYVDATEEPWAKHYRMWTYVTEELPALVAAEFPVDMDAAGDHRPFDGRARRADRRAWPSRTAFAASPRSRRSSRRARCRGARKRLPAISATTARRGASMMRSR